MSNSPREGAEDGLDKAARRVEALRRLVTNLIWLAIILVVLAAAGRWFMQQQQRRQPPTAQAPAGKVLPPPIPWQEVDQAVAAALRESRAEAATFAAARLDLWTGALMTRVDSDFLDWYFSYWTQQLLGLKGLWQQGLHFFLEQQPGAAEKLTEQLQEEFAARVLRPQVAELELEHIVRDTALHYVEQLQGRLEQLPERYRIPRTDWERYLAGIAATTGATEANRETPLTLKTLTVSGAGGAALLAGNLKVLLGKLGPKVMAKSTGKAASQMAAKTGTKVAAKAGGKFLGTIVGVGVLAWDVWDHRATVRENRPILRQALRDYLHELQDILLNDPEAGLMTVFDDFSRQMAARAGHGTGSED